MSEAKAVVVSRSRHLSAIWIVPVVAVLLGVWMVAYNFYNEGPTIEIRFSTAAGIEAEKTKIRALDVEVGVVGTVRFSDDYESVVVEAKIDKFAEALLRSDSEFWVVRPRIGADGISGLGTIVSGPYIQLLPGNGEPNRRSFRGLDEPPVTPTGTPGLRVTLFSERGGSLGAGDPVLFRGVTVGRVEDMSFDFEHQLARYQMFIDAPYDTFVNSATRFWNVSGISFKASAAGVSLDTESLQSLLTGGVAFDLPEGITPGAPVTAGAEFKLYPTRESINVQPFAHYVEYVVAFKQSLRGLLPGAPVEMRGVRVGTVDHVMVAELVQLSDTQGKAFPVLIRIEPGRFQVEDSQDGVDRVAANIRESVANGLRASLQSANLLTGRQIVALDHFPDAAEATLGEFAGYAEIPTIEGGLGRLEQEVRSLLAKINALPLDEIAGSLRDSLVRLDGTLATASRAFDDINATFTQAAVQELPDDLAGTLAELRQVMAGYSADSPLYGELQSVVSEARETLARLDALTRTLEAKPNALIFGHNVGPDPEPKGAQ